MAREVKRLTDRGIKAIGTAGRHADGDGLYLVVDEGGAKRWVFLFRWRQPGQAGSGRLREMGLGGLNVVSLAEAREKADMVRRQARSGVDPILAAKARKVAPTFGEMADTLVADLSPQWRNEKHKAQWRMTLTRYAEPLRAKPVDTITTEDVLEVLQPIWSEKSDTASRVRGRIERVLDAAKARGHRSGENPARWRGHLDHLLPKRQKLSRGHHAALPYAEMSAFTDTLRQRAAPAGRALEFLILTAARSGEVLGAQWSEIDFKARLWTIPAGRMKAGREHRVPLSDRATAILAQLHANKTGQHVFASARADKPLSGMAMEMMLRRMKVDVTVHGFRSSFRDWAGEVTQFPREVAEAALAHTVGDQTERAYRRGDALEKRRELMQAWGRFCEPGDAADNVVPLTAGGAR